MKISKQRLAEIVKEEIEASSEQPKQAQDPDAKTSDAKVIIAKMPSIDLPHEYQEILQAVLKHNVKQKDMIIKKVFGPSVGGTILKMLGGE